jgi:competence protein ComEC
MLAATLSAEIALLPVAASLFGRVTSAGLLLNFAAIPLMTIVQAGSMIALAASLVHVDSAIACGYLVHLAARGLVDSARLVDVVPWMARELPPPAWSLVASYYLAVMVALAVQRLRTIALAATAILGVTMVLGAHATTRDAVRLPPHGSLRVVFLDVGQGDATLLILPDDRAILVDAGGLPVAPLQDPADGPSFDIGERVVARALRAFGVRTLDTFVLTHADPDHLGGALSVLRSFRPRAIWDGVPVPEHEGRRRLVDESVRQGA